MRTLAAFLIATACTSLPEDDESDSIAGDGKADSAFTPADLAAAVRVANELTRAELDDDVPLSGRAAKNIALHRAGADGVDGTSDDDRFDDAAELDAVPYVGPVAFAAMVDYARDHGWVTTAIGATGTEDWFAPNQVLIPGSVYAD